MAKKAAKRNIEQYNSHVLNFYQGTICTPLELTAPDGYIKDMRS